MVLQCVTCVSLVSFESGETIKFPLGKKDRPVISVPVRACRKTTNSQSGLLFIWKQFTANIGVLEIILFSVVFLES